MTTLPRLTNAFLDTAYAVALASPADAQHERAALIARLVAADHTRIVTTRAKLVEIGNALARRQYRAGARAFLTAIENDPAVEVLPLSDDLYERAFELSARDDKDWGMTDCISFVVMADRGIAAALTTDDHFVQAGFRALLREA